MGRAAHGPRRRLAGRDARQSQRRRRVVPFAPARGLAPLRVAPLAVGIRGQGRPSRLKSQVNIFGILLINFGRPMVTRGRCRCKANPRRELYAATLACREMTRLRTKKLSALPQHFACRLGAISTQRLVHAVRRHFGKFQTKQGNSAKKASGCNTLASCKLMLRGRKRSNRVTP